MKACYLGRMAFGEAWALQRRLWEERAAGRLAEDALLLLDHEPVFTLGQGGAEANVLRTRAPWHPGEVPVVRINRGGEVTYHGPGQLMLYGLCDLRARDRDVHRHCRRLEEVFVRYLGALGVRAGRRPGQPGLWVEGAKILSLGVGARRWITMHGVSFNVSTDLRFFEMIHPCGEAGARMTSLERLLGAAPPLRQVAEEIVPLCEDVFGERIHVEPDAASLLAASAGAA